jgi:heme oxygenase
LAPPEGAGLRAATAAAHERVDAIYSQFDLADRDGYRRFLLAQAIAFLPVEAALDAAGAEMFILDWPERRRAHLIRADLDELGEEAVPAMAPPLIAGAGAVLGAAYVIEGSRLGGKLLRQAVPDELPRRFLDAPQKSASWRRLLENLDSRRYEPGFFEAAIHAAVDVFDRFASSGHRLLGDERA